MKFYFGVLVVEWTENCQIFVLGDPAMLLENWFTFGIALYWRQRNFQDAWRLHYEVLWTDERLMDG
jgi:hypothetical protein